MRNGHAYKMKRLLETGTAREKIYEMFKTRYSPEQIDLALPRKKRRRKKEVSDGPGDDLQPSPCVTGSEDDHVSG